LGKLKKIDLKLNSNATLKTIENLVKASYNPVGTSTGDIKGDIDADLTEIYSRKTPHPVKQPDGSIKDISVKINTLNLWIDENNEVTGYSYQED
jgi:hypothetical protein